MSFEVFDTINFDIQRLLLSLLNRKDKFKLLLYVLIQIVLSILDLLGIALLALLISIGTDNEMSNSSLGLVASVFRFSEGFGWSSGNLVLFLGLASISILILKTLLSLFTLRKVTNFLGYKSSVTTGELVQKVFSRSLIQLQSRTIFSTSSIVTNGVNIIYFDILLRYLLIFTDLTMIIIMVSALLLFNPFIAFLSIAIFGSVGIILFLVMQKRASVTGKLKWELTVKTSEDILQVLSTFRETYIKNRLPYFSEKIRKARLELSHTQSLSNFLPLVSKYAFETVVTVSAILIALLEFRFGDSKTAIASLAVFLGTATRIAPAALRIQQSAIELKGGIGSIKPVLEFINELYLVEIDQCYEEQLDTSHLGFVPNIKLESVFFSYPGSQKTTLDNISLNLEANKVYAVVGPSGSGKSTLIDLMLGLLTPDSGTVEISGLAPRETIRKWQGAIGYVPQDVVIVNSSIAENIHLGYPVNDQTTELVAKSIMRSQLFDMISSLPNGTDSIVGDSGSKLSGGQRQRLGIARALYSNPKLLVLDEATSSLDGLTEESVASSIFQNTDITVVTIAHRISTIRKADSIIYLNEGKVEFVGNFQQARQRIPDFDQQIKFMGMKE